MCFYEIQILERVIFGWKLELRMMTSLTGLSCNRGGLYGRWGGGRRCESRQKVEWISILSWGSRCSSWHLSEFSVKLQRIECDMRVVVRWKVGEKSPRERWNRKCRIKYRERKRPEGQRQRVHLRLFLAHYPKNTLIIPYNFHKISIFSEKSQQFNKKRWNKKV